MAINYRHLYYFMRVAECGGITRASERLHLSPQTVSAQIQLLEDRLGRPLFERSKGRLVLSEAGRRAYDIAREIFELGARLEAAVRDDEEPDGLEFRVGVADAVPKSIAWRLIDPATRIDADVRIVCREWRLERLLAELAAGRLDLVIADAPVDACDGVATESRCLGRSGTGFYAAASLREAHPGPFPDCLDGAPVLLPGEDSAVGHRLRDWFRVQALRPRVIGEFDDGALAHEFGRRGAAFFAAPVAIAAELEAQVGATLVGEAAGVDESFHAIWVPKRPEHPCIEAIADAPRDPAEFARPPAVPRATGPRIGAAGA